MAFFDNDDDDESSEEKPNIHLFENFYKNGEYVFFTVDQWEACYNYYLYDCNKVDYKILDFIIVEALAQHNYSVFFALRAAELLSRQNRFKESMEKVSHAMTLSPSDFEVYECAAHIYEHFKKYEIAIKYYKLAAQKGADGFDIRFQLALCYLNCNKRETALKYFTQLTVMQPKNEFVLDHIAIIVFDEEWFAQGKQIFENVIDNHPYSESAWHYLGNCFLAMDDIVNAIWAQEMVIAINEDSYIGYFGLANCLQENEDYVKAIEQYHFLMTQYGSDTNLYCNMAYCYEKLEHFEKARKYYRKSIAMDAKCAQAWHGIGMTLLAEDKIKETLYFFKTAYKFDKHQNSQFGLSLAAAYMDNDEMEKAQKIFEKLLTVFPEDFEVWLDYSMLYSEQKNYERALDLLQTALFYLPDCHQINYRIAAILIKMKKNEHAVAFLEKGLKKNFSDHDLIYIFEPKFKKHKELQMIIKNYKK